MAEQDLTLYDYLGVAPNASYEEIRRAYRAFMARLHPDAFREVSADRLLFKINEAWETLGDPERRRRYDDSLPAVLFIGTRGPDKTITNPASLGAAGRVTWPPRSAPHIQEQETPDLIVRPEDAPLKPTSQRWHVVAPIFYVSIFILLIIAAGTFGPRVGSTTLETTRMSTTSFPSVTHPRPPALTRTHAPVPSAVNLKPAPRDASLSQPTAATALANTSTVRPLVSQPHLSRTPAPLQGCRNAVVTMVSSDGANVELSDAHTYQVNGGYDQVVASGWSTGDDVSVCTQPSGDAVYASIQVGDKKVQAVQSSAVATQSSVRCASHGIVRVSGNGADLELSDGHTYQVNGGYDQVVASGWSTGDDVSVCTQSSGGNVYASIQAGDKKVQAVQSSAVATQSSVRCSSHGVVRVSGNGADVELNDGRTYQINEGYDQVVASGWSTGDDVTVCTQSSGDAVYASIQVGDNKVQAVQISGVANQSPVRCSSYRVVRVSGSGADLELSDGHTYQINGGYDQVVASGWSTGDDVAVCTQSSGDAVYASIQVGDQKVQATRER